MTEEEFKKKMFLLDSSLTLISKFECVTKHVLVKSEFGIHKISPCYFLLGQKVTINSALDKADYKKNKIQKLVGDKFIILKTGDSNKSEIHYKCQNGHLSVKKIADFLINYNCVQCYKDKYEYTEEKVLIKMNELFNNKYKYSFLDFKNTHSKLIITCPIHGDFESTPHNHLRKRGCIKCNKDLRTKEGITNNNIGWTRSKWKERFEKTNHKEKNKPIVYVVKLINKETNEIFYKIGRTFLKLNCRLRKNFIFYNYEEICQIESDCNSIYNLENKLHAYHKKFKYSPKIKFKGYSECYSEIDLEMINYLRYYNNLKNNYTK